MPMKYGKCSLFLPKNEEWNTKTQPKPTRDFDRSLWNIWTIHIDCSRWWLTCIGANMTINRLTEHWTGFTHCWILIHWIGRFVAWLNPSLKCYKYSILTSFKPECSEFCTSERTNERQNTLCVLFFVLLIINFNSSLVPCTMYAHNEMCLTFFNLTLYSTDFIFSVFNVVVYCFTRFT